jgi:hypothetical protein
MLRLLRRAVLAATVAGITASGALAHDHDTVDASGLGANTIQLTSD